MGFSSCTAAVLTLLIGQALSQPGSADEPPNFVTGDPYV
ncbi:hypothetical protein Y032_0239g3303, partial [Ancylostoma ceylanicum]